MSEELRDFQDIDEKDYMESSRKTSPESGLAEIQREYAAVLGSLYSLVEKGEVRTTSSQLRPQVNSRLENPLSHEDLEEHMNFLFREMPVENVLNVEGDETPFRETVYNVENFGSIIGAARELRDNGEEELELSEFDDLIGVEEDEYMIDLPEEEEFEYSKESSMESLEDRGSSYM